MGWMNKMQTEVQLFFSRELSDKLAVVQMLQRRRAPPHSSPVNPNCRPGFRFSFTLGWNFPLLAFVSRSLKSIRYSMVWDRQ